MSNAFCSRCIPFVSWIRRPNVLSKVQFKTCLEQLGKGAYYTRKYEGAGSRSSGSLKMKEETIDSIRVILELNELTVLFLVHLEYLPVYGTCGSTVCFYFLIL